MAGDSKLFENIRLGLEARGIRMSPEDVRRLYDYVFENISEILDRGDIVDISGFGSFWRKKNGGEPATFYKPSEDILERINTNK